MPWDPDQYHRFRGEREQPFHDLTALVERREGMRIIDLGCGTGELTARLAGLMPNSDVLGIDASQEMLERASALARPGLRFELGDLLSAGGTWDLVFSHAALQWVDNHHRLIPHLMSILAPGGQLAVQMPSNHDAPAHRVLKHVASTEPFASALHGWSRRSPVLQIDEYASLLFDCGACDIVVLERVYPHVLPNAHEVAQWMAGTALVPYMERLPPGLQPQFMDSFTAQLQAQFPNSPVFYGFKRVLLSARAAA